MSRRESTRREAADMFDTFPGALRVRHLPSIDVVITVNDGSLRIDTDREELGSWPLDQCRVAPAPEDGSFRMVVEGEEATFTPADPQGFAAVAAAEFRSASLADRRGVLRSAGPLPAVEDPGTEPVGSPVDLEVPRPSLPAPDRVVAWMRRYRYVGFVASALLAGALAAALGIGPAGEPPPTLAGGAGESPVASSVPTPVDAFALSPRGFADRWNDVADGLGVDLRVLGVSGAGSFEARLAEHILLQGVVGADGTVDAIVLTADPAVDVDGRRLVIAAWGVLIAVADPSLDPAGRARILSELGIDVSRPELPGLDGIHRTDGLRFSIRYLEGLSSVLFSVEEA